MFKLSIPTLRQRQYQTRRGKRGAYVVGGFPHWAVALLSDGRGGSSVQYIVLVGVVALLAIGSWRQFGGSLTEATRRESEKVRSLEASNASDTPSTGGALPAIRATQPPASPGGDSVATAAPVARRSSGVAGLTAPSRTGATPPPAPAATPIAAAPAETGAVDPVAAPPPNAPPPPPSPEPPRTPTPAAPAERSSTLSNFINGATGFGLGVLQGVTPGGFLTNAIPVPPNLAHSRAYQYWNGAGQVMGGVVAVTTGTAGEVVGIAADSTGVGAIVGVPVNVASAAQIASGATSVAAGIVRMTAASGMADEPAPKPTESTPEPKPEPAPKGEPAEKPPGPAEPPAGQAARPVGPSHKGPLSAGKNFKDHFVSKRPLVEKALKMKVGKLSEGGGDKLLKALGEGIDNGTFKYVGQGTLKKGAEAMNIFRGEGVTIVTKSSGEWVTVLTTGEGMDVGILMVP